jgi:hypothetical protein
VILPNLRVRERMFRSELRLAERLSSSGLEGKISELPMVVMAYRSIVLRPARPWMAEPAGACLAPLEDVIMREMGQKKKGAAGPNACASPRRSLASGPRGFYVVTPRNEARA